MPSNTPSTSLSRRDGRTPTASRPLPQSVGAEAAVLGSMIVDPRCIPDVMADLEASDFLHPEHVAIYEVIRALYEKNNGQGVDGLLVREALSDRGLLERIGGGDEDRGTTYLQQVMDTVPSSVNAGYYRDVVKEKSRRRFVIATGGNLIEAAYDESEPVESLLNESQAKLFAITDRDRRSNAAAELGNLAVAAFEDMGKREKGMLRGLSSGFYKMDELTCGFRQGDMILIAGRPSMGKTSLAMDVALHAGIVQQKGVAIFSLEMSGNQLAERSLCSWAEVDSQKAAHGALSVEEFQRLVEAAGRFRQARVVIDDDSGLTPFQLRSKARQYQSQYGIDLIVIDYIQLMDASGRVENRQQEITQISRQIKAVARELDIPVIALSQLNRGPEGREDHRPRMSDLRDSGSLEQDADVIILLHREDYYHRSEPEYVETHTAEAIIAKQRKGPVGTVELSFREPFSKFVNHIEIPETKLLTRSESPSQGQEPW
jgi:replicative DNA helicase